MFATVQEKNKDEYYPFKKGDNITFKTLDQITEDITCEELVNPKSSKTEKLMFAL